MFAVPPVPTMFHQPRRASASTKDLATVVGLVEIKLEKIREEGADPVLLLHETVRYNPSSLG